MADLIGSVVSFGEALPFYKIFPTPLYKKLKKAVLTLQSIGKEYVDDNYHHLKATAKDLSNQKSLSLLEQWLLEGNMSEEQCILSAIDMFAAGVDNVSLNNFDT